MSNVGVEKTSYEAGYDHAVQEIIAWLKSQRKIYDAAAISRRFGK